VFETVLEERQEMNLQELMDEIEINEQMEDVMTELKQVLMDRDGLTEEEADEQIKEARGQLQEYLAEGDICAAEDICEEMFGLEPDYVMDLM